MYFNLESCCIDGNGYLLMLVVICGTHVTALPTIRSVVTMLNIVYRIN